MTVHGIVGDTATGQYTDLVKVGDILENVLSDKLLVILR